MHGLQEEAALGVVARPAVQCPARPGPALLGPHLAHERMGHRVRFEQRQRQLQAAGSRHGRAGTAAPGWAGPGWAGPRRVVRRPGRAGAAMATAAEERGREGAREEAPDGAGDEAAAGAEETVKIICLGDSAVGKSKCVRRGGPAGSGGGPAGSGGPAAGPAGSRRPVLSPQAAGAVSARWLVSLGVGERGSGAITTGGGVGPARCALRNGVCASPSAP